MAFVTQFFDDGLNFVVNKRALAEYTDTTSFKFINNTPYTPAKWWHCQTGATWFGWIIPRQKGLHYIHPIYCLAWYHFFSSPIEFLIYCVVLIYQIMEDNVNNKLIREWEYLPPVSTEVTSASVLYSERTDVPEKSVMQMFLEGVSRDPALATSRGFYHSGAKTSYLEF